MSTRVALILGAGPNIGSQVASAFQARGYKVALASRSADAAQNTDSKVHVKVDLTQPETVGAVFEEVEERLGTPEVVIYNAAVVNVTSAENPLDPSKINVEVFSRNLAINTTSVFAAAQATITAFAKLPDSASKTFLYTGNGLIAKSSPRLVDLGVGKAASAHLIQVLAQTYRGKGWKFYYVDERQADGGFSMPVSGEAAAEFYPQLAEGKEQETWLQTFVKGKGYVDFSGK
ncbi:NAD(P)-binding protein [Lentithecium fluviatile CBS 122367]|uniref:NAD(P)-binding protein n=1 Tax=Lentithecium fluviatile CBS 122367 TaxID=1168545 RepID=A0A6G1J2N9_9PLEO|nr:NAD(P)-binding protein [Lentithecium fluviatile CBS 122367]